MKNKLILLCIAIIILQSFFINVTFSAEQTIKPITTVFLKFADNTKYTEINTASMTSELLLTELTECKYISLVERFPIVDAINAEKKMNATEEAQHEAIEKQDFGFVFNVEERSMNSKRRGDSLPSDDTRLIGEKYKANYLLHGAIEFLGTDIITDEGLKYYTGISRTTLYLTAIITVRLIHANTGEVVWAKSIRGISKDNFFEYQGIGVGTKKLNSQLFFKAVKKACEITKKELTADFEKGLIKLPQ